MKTILSRLLRKQKLSMAFLLGLIEKSCFGRYFKLMESCCFTNADSLLGRSEFVVLLIIPYIKSVD